ncbi:MAG: hypothetical protein OIF35_06150 [Cellvibrionaceae bacterium]|nr:hypothetical protein [Cellvibrionaceae bacterium]MCV6625149.1 hypothetical protein [Cellvibrionaceae bacterium]
MDKQWQAYAVAALLLFGAGLWASNMAGSYITVIALMGVPSLVGGYIFNRFPLPYIWGALLGVALYMGLEYVLYGAEVYKVSGPVYAAGYLLAVACCLTGVWLANWRKAGA